MVAWVLKDFQDFDRIKAGIDEGSEEVVPAEVAFALIRGENPIRVRREYRKLTQQALARALKVDVGSLITG